MQHSNSIPEHRFDIELLDDLPIGMGSDGTTLHELDHRGATAASVRVVRMRLRTRAGLRNDEARGGKSKETGK
jgi:hypothetical protein